MFHIFLFRRSLVGSSVGYVPPSVSWRHMVILFSLGVLQIWSNQILIIYYIHFTWFKKLQYSWSWNDILLNIFDLFCLVLFFFVVLNPVFEVNWTRTCQKWISGKKNYLTFEVSLFASCAYFARGSFKNISHTQQVTWGSVCAYRWYLVPRVLRDVSVVDMSISVLGHKLSMPLCVGSTAMQRLAHPAGETATARG